MFSSIITFLSNNLSDVFTTILYALRGGIDVLFTHTAGVDTVLWTSDDVFTLNDVGELVLLVAVVGLAMFGLRWVRSIIPFVK